MRRSALLLVTIVVAICFSASNCPAAILYFKDLSVGTDRMAQALTSYSGVTTASSIANFQAELATGNYELGIFFQQNQSGAAYDAAIAQLGTFASGGGKAIFADWTRNDVHAAAFGADYTGTFNGSVISLTPGVLDAGIVNPPVNLINPGWGVFSTGLEDSGIVAGRFTNNSQAAIVINNVGSGRAIVNGFLNDTFADGPEGVQLYKNEIDLLLGPQAVPEPSTLTILGLGSLGLALGAFRQRRKAKC